MFQNVNVAKSAPFTLITIYQKKKSAPFALLTIYQKKKKNPCIPPKFSKLPPTLANYAKFAHFVNLFYIMFQASAPAENPGKIQRITQIPHDSPTQPANSAHFAL